MLVRMKTENEDVLVNPGQVVGAYNTPAPRGKTGRWILVYMAAGPALVMPYSLDEFHRLAAEEPQ